MTHCYDGFAGFVEGFNQRDRGCVIGHVPHRPVSTWIKDRVEVACGNLSQLLGVGKFRLCSRVLVEAFCRESEVFWPITDRVDGGFAALWRRQRDLHSRVLQYVIGS